MREEQQFLTYRNLEEVEIERKLFTGFKRHQIVTDCWRKADGEWKVTPHAFVDEWSEKDYQMLIKCLKNTIQTGGVVFGAFLSGVLKGFSSVEGERFGSRKQYADLSCIHVSEDMRGNGIGKKLFWMDCEWAREKGAEKLYISGHSAVETQAFYHAMGCQEAQEYHQKHVEQEPYDCQLEYML